VREITMKNIIAISTGTLLLLCGNSMAQVTAEVRVEATRIVSKEAPVRSPIGFPMKDLSLTYGVSLGDLNLATKAGAAEAERRVNDAAFAACKQIGRQYPDATPNEDECARDAAKKAMVKVHDLVAAAEKTAKK
jgi:UrcA family protein